MDSYGSYVASPDIEAETTQHRKAPSEDTKVLPTQGQHPQLPPFREILGPGDHCSTESPSSAALATKSEGHNMTRRTFQPAFGSLKIEAPSPERLQIGNSLDNFDNMSAQSSDSAYSDPRHHRQQSSWTSASPYSELVSPYTKQQRVPCTLQTQFAHPKVESSLPSIHDLTYQPSYTTATGSYGYATSHGGYNDHRSYSMKQEMPTLYEPNPRFAQPYSQINRPAPTHMDYARYGATMYDYPKAIGFPPYSVEYMPSPSGSHHPVSPTVSNGGEIGGGRKRRGNLPKNITDYLKAWFMAHLDRPYPSEDEKQQFVMDTGLSIAQISNWFINARRRHLPTWRNQAQDNSRRAQAAPIDYNVEQVRRSHKSFD